VLQCGWAIQTVELRTHLNRSLCLLPRLFLSRADYIIYNNPAGAWSSSSHVCCHCLTGTKHQVGLPRRSLDVHWSLVSYHVPALFSVRRGQERRGFGLLLSTCVPRSRTSLSIPVVAAGVATRSSYK